MLKPQLIESTKQPLLAGTSADPSGGGAGSRLNFVIQHQEQRLWCWAAVTVSIFDFYRNGSSRQCDVVNIEKGLTDCCVNGSVTPCNEVGPLGRPLDRNHNLNVISPGPTALAILKIEIDNGRPVGCRVEWSRSGAHFMVVYGYGDSLVNGVVINTIEIADPSYDYSIQNLDTFPSKYHGGKGWSHSYFTKP